MDEECALLLTQDTGAVVGSIVGDMSDDSVVLLQLSGQPPEIRNGCQSRYKGLYCYSSRHGSLDNRLCDHNGFFRLARTTRNVIDDAQSGLRHHKDFLLGTYLRTAVAALIVIKLGITDSGTDVGFEVPIAPQRPGIAVEKADGSEVALTTLIAHRLPKSEGELDIGYVIVAVDEVDAEEMVNTDRVSPIAEVRRQEQMLPLARLLLVGRPGTIAAGQSHRPMGR